MHDQVTEFSGVAGRVLRESLSLPALASGVVLIVVLGGGAFALIAAGAPGAAGPFAQIVVALVLARFALNGLHGEWRGTLFSGRGGSAGDVAIVGVRYLVLTALWLVPMLLTGAGTPSPGALGAPGMLPAVSGGAATLGFLYLAAMMLTPPLFLIVAVSATGFGELFSPDHWRRTFGGRSGDLLSIYAVYLGALGCVLAISMPLLGSAAMVNPRLALVLAVLDGIFVLGLSLTLLGRLCGFFAFGEDESAPSTLRPAGAGAPGTRPAAVSSGGAGSGAASGPAAGPAPGASRPVPAASPAVAAPPVRAAIPLSGADPEQAEPVAPAGGSTGPQAPHTAVASRNAAAQVGTPAAGPISPAVPGGAASMPTPVGTVAIPLSALQNSGSLPESGPEPGPEPAPAGPGTQATGDPGRDAWCAPSGRPAPGDDPPQVIESARRRFEYDAEGAISMLDELRESRPDHPVLLYTLCLMRLKAGRTAAGVQIGREAMRACLATGDPAPVARLFRRLWPHLRTLGLSTGQVLEATQALLQQQDLATAAKACAYLIRSGSTNPRAIKILMKIAETKLGDASTAADAEKIYRFLLQHCSQSPLVDYFRRGLEQATRAVA